ncbi:MAG: RtcB family protein [Candidatus Thermoplasmatota archaeon]|nr:RtcB family protein [Candidatus Thermoplasmatota archaeon]
MLHLNKLTDFQYEIPATGSMRVPGILYINDRILGNFSDDEPLQQVMNVASLPGIVKASLAMPDIHLGYGFPIGGVAAFDYYDGIISPGGVGYDINCGVSLIATNLDYNMYKDSASKVLDELYKTVPAGIDNKSSFRINNDDESEILSSGIEWAYNNGYATREDILHTEENGHMPANISKVSEKAIKRGKNELGTLGAGNHFLEIDRIDRIFDDKTAGKFGTGEKNKLAIMVHTGSRGLGHQVATDYLMRLNENDESVKIPADRQLISAFTASKAGMDYMDAMNAAANFGFVNRQIITYKIRRAFEKVIGMDFESMGINMVYSLAHNMAKVETHSIDGIKRKLIVHRKGATRAQPANSASGYFADTGNPVIIPGHMGGPSYLLVGSTGNEETTFSSSCHGAGRLLSRKRATEQFTLEGVRNDMESRGIYLRATTGKAVVEESPGSYKNIEDVIDVIRGAGIASPVASLMPVAVMKG